MKYFSLVILFVLFSCGNKETVLLPKSNVTIVSEVQDHSPIYIFFITKDKDTLAEVNRNNSISSTNGIFNIDKRLPLKLVIPEVMKIQEKKRNSAHKNELAENYYSYADSIGKNMAFLPFTKVFYKMEKPEFGHIVFFDKQNKINTIDLLSMKNVLVKKENLQEYLNGLPSDKPHKFIFCFANDLPFGKYIEDEILIQSLKFPIPNINRTNVEFIF
ncbi:hypothetical protein [Flavobacterium nackdongense]|uniref:Lipoprotein n=1 Tax=Flavobacterium nackdongense TaxID=2547394 RepID=A0A4P6Y8M6_9FLAO|nr:hypothetical protein [Flavobacterium nackdongense]QBN18188.1 hypothetical protein E1750_05000 [Flavobacterium nackdongense]